LEAALEFLAAVGLVARPDAAFVDDLALRSTAGFVRLAFFVLAMSLSVGRKIAHLSLPT
jgi:hypothetical protein